MTEAGFRMHSIDFNSTIPWTWVAGSPCVCSSGSNSTPCSRFSNSTKSAFSYVWDTVWFLGGCKTAASPSGLNPQVVSVLISLLCPRQNQQISIRVWQSACSSIFRPKDSKYLWLKLAKLLGWDMHSFDDLKSVCKTTDICYLETR